MRRASIREMSGRVTVKVRFAGGDATFGRPTEWTSFRARENELGLRALRPLLSKAMQVSASALNYLQYQDADGETSCRPCTSGYLCAEGASAPQPCPSGTYAPLTSSFLRSLDECILCPPGTAVFTPARTRSAVA